MTNKDKILNTALKLITDNGFSGTSMNNIIETSGVSTGGVYYHFKTKEDIIHNLYLKIKNDTIEYIFKHVDLEAPTRIFIEQFWYSRVNWSINHPDYKKFMDMLFQSPYQEIRVCEELAIKYGQLINRVDNAIKSNEIITLDCFYFIADLDGSVNVILNYIDKYQKNNTDELLSFAFKKYWRSIANM